MYIKLIAVSLKFIPV